MKAFSFRTVLVGALLLALGACASGEKLSATTQVPVPQQMGRIYVYRTTAFGAAVQPAVKLNGEKIGNAVPKGVYVLDRPPGNYEISTATEVTRSVTLTLEAGQVRYVKLKMGFGFFAGHVIPELVEDSVGKKEIQDLHLLTYQPKAASTP